MEQVFTLVNTVLQSDSETSRRKLNVRGYTIVPLGAQAGVLEFVINTTPMQEWLQSAHQRYGLAYAFNRLLSISADTTRRTGFRRSLVCGS
jgi:phosphatidylinositol kinase/protein kinase (PI-3  family)